MKAKIINAKESAFALLEQMQAAPIRRVVRKDGTMTVELDFPSAEVAERFLGSVRFMVKNKHLA